MKTQYFIAISILGLILLITNGSHACYEPPPDCTPSPGAFSLSAPEDDSTFTSKEGIVLEWGESSNADLYSIHLGKVGYYLECRGYTGGLSWTVPSSLLEYGKTYNWMIRARNSGSGCTPTWRWSTGKWSFSVFRVKNITQGIGYDIIQDALDYANEGDTIMVIPGTYAENLDFDGVEEITLTSTEPTNPAVVAATIIDGGSGGSVVTFDSGDADSTITGFTITNGSAANGGGIYCNGVSPTVSNCVISGNTATSNGGGMYCYSNSNPDIKSCLFRDNEATNEHGGGLYMISSNPDVESCTFSQNSADNGYGGGIYINASSPDIENSILWGNTDSIGADFVAEESSTITFNYNDYGYWGDDETTSFIGVVGVISTDPLFGDPGNNDFHLKSSVGRWNGSSWDTDASTSPCVDTGDPSSGYSNEPTPNGSRINMGFYGNTSEASKSNKDIYVSTSGSDSTDNGTIGNPYATIQKGINMVADGGSVIVTGGLFNERFSFTSGHKGFTLTTTGSSIIDGQDGGRVFSFSSVSSSITIKNFTIQEGRINNAGGGAYIYNSNNITFDDCDFEDNEAYNYSGEAYGGAVYIQDCDPAFDYCNFDNNQVYGELGVDDDLGYGGAIFTANASATFDHCEIGETGNAALNNSSSDEIFTYGSTVPTYTYCKIRGWDQDSPFVDGDYMAYTNSGPSGSNNSDF